jgi:hypothetical protein
MSKRKRRAQAQAASVTFDRAREYVVYWRNGLKSHCSGHRVIEAVAFYLTRARLILDAETRKPVFVAD